MCTAQTTACGLPALATIEALEDATVITSNDDRAGRGWGDDNRPDVPHGETSPRPICSTIRRFVQPPLVCARKKHARVCRIECKRKNQQIADAVADFHPGVTAIAALEYATPRSRVDCIAIERINLQRVDLRIRQPHISCAPVRTKVQRFENPTTVCACICDRRRNRIDGKRFYE